MKVEDFSDMENDSKDDDLSNHFDNDVEAASPKTDPGSSDSGESDGDIKLMEGVKIGEKRKKKKKERSEDLQKKLELEEVNFGLTSSILCLIIYFRVF